MLHIDNQTTHKINFEKLNLIYENLTNKDLELILTDNETIKNLNNQHRNKNTPTDVLSFPFENIPYAPLGTIVISVDMALHVSKNLSHTLEDEISLLFIHGFLHVSGYDHETDNGKMRKKEKELIKKFNLPKSLIVRTLT